MDPKTIESFAGLVQSPERLRLLLVLTVCDIRDGAELDCRATAVLGSSGRGCALGLRLLGTHQCRSAHGNERDSSYCAHTAPSI